jgi:hypothetical protein
MMANCIKDTPDYIVIGAFNILFEKDTYKQKRWFIYSYAMRHASINIFETIDKRLFKLAIKDSRLNNNIILEEIKKELFRSITYTLYAPYLNCKCINISDIPAYTIEYKPIAFNELDQSFSISNTIGKIEDIITESTGISSNLLGEGYNYDENK